MIMTAANAEPVGRVSLRFKARLAGFFWLLVIITGTLAIAGGATGEIANLAATAFYVGATLLVYELLKPVNRKISFIAAAASLAGCAIGFGSFLHLAPFVALANVRANFIFFGLHVFLVGYLIVRSTFLPHFVGAFLLIGGSSWLTLGIVSVVSASLATSMLPSIMFPGVIAETSLTLWLLIASVDVQRWNEQARS
jgi:hypothetical protein